MRIHWLATKIVATLVVGLLCFSAVVASAQVGQPQFNTAPGAPVQGSPFVNPAVLPQSNPWTTPPAKPSMADRAESVLSKNPLALAWNGLKNRQAKKPTQVPSVNRSQVDPIALQQPTGPPTPELFVNLAALSEQRGQTQLAREQLTQALTLAPNHVGARLGAARMEDRLGDLKQAEELYRQVVQLVPQDPTALNDLALCLARQSRFDESAELLEQTVQLNPQKPLYRNNLATVLVELKRDNEALAQLIAAHGPAVGNYNLGHLLSKGGRTAEAAECYAKAAQIDPNFGQAHAALAALTPRPAPTQVIQNQAPANPYIARQPYAPTGQPAAQVRTLPPVTPGQTR